MPSGKREPGRGRCGCWAAVARGLRRGACFGPPAEADGDRAAAAAKGSHVHDAGGTSPTWFPSSLPLPCFCFRVVGSRDGDLFVCFCERFVLACLFFSAQRVGLATSAVI